VPGGLGNAGEDFVDRGGFSNAPREGCHDLVRTCAVAVDESVCLFMLAIVGMASAVLRSVNDVVISLLATGIVAVGFQPLRDWLQRLNAFRAHVTPGLPGGTVPL
jgi:hypothetical protein